MARRPIILFDVMETLVGEPFFTALPAFFGITAAQLRADLHPTAWVEFEEGLLSETQYYARFFRDGRPVDGERLRVCLRDAYRWVDGMEELVADLYAAGFEMHALSNYSTWYELIEQALGLRRYLAWTFVSCVTGLRKPAPEAFWNAARTLGVAPRNCLFIDDQPENVEAARAVGMDALITMAAADLRREFERRGLLPAHAC